ncbi:MAG: ASCH domain-containing protein [Thiomargarita sp.]|nr:ASCH domain-containing protein [Thiomargarita sp.]
MSSNILLSVRPKYANKIFEHAKTVELRRVRPKRLEPGDWVLIYVSSPVQALVGAFKVDKIVKKPLKDLWQMVQKKAGATRQEFDAYYDGVSVGVGIFFKVQDVQKLDKPITLDILKKQSFHPPQGFRYCRASDITWFNEMSL